MKGLSLILLYIISSVYGHMHFRLRIPNGFNVTHPCPGKGLWEAVGHMETVHTTVKNVFGMNFLRNGLKWNKALCMEDSDGDGLTNGEELGDPACKWEAGAPLPLGDVRGHPGFCEPNRPQCLSGSTYAECRNPHAKARAPEKKHRIRLPPGANDHPQTRKLKELMRMQNRNTEAMKRGGIVPRFTTMPGAGQRWLPQQRTVISNDITRPTIRPRLPEQNRWQQPQTISRPAQAVGQSVFGHGNFEASRQTGGSFNNRDRQNQPISLSRDFGMTIDGTLDSQMIDSNRLNRFANIGRQNERFTSNNIDSSSNGFQRSPNRMRSSGSQNIDTRISGSFQRQPYEWNTFSNGGSFRQETAPNTGQHFISRSDRTSFNRISGNDRQSSNRRGDSHGNRRLSGSQDGSGSSNLLTGSSGVAQTMSEAGSPWSSFPMMPGVPRPGMPGMPMPGAGMRFPPF